MREVSEAAMRGSEDDDSLLALFDGLDSCAVSDALDTLGMRGATTGVRPLWGVDRAVVGVAKTVTAGPREAGRPAQHIGAAAIESAGSREVLVVANDGRTDVSCFGGILAIAAAQRGIRGVVIDGACRDISESEELGFAVFGRAVVPVSARGRIVQLAMDETIDFAGVRVDSGDIVLADSNGVVSVARRHAARVARLAARIVAREEAMAAAVRAGGSVAEIMHDSKFPTEDES